MPDANLSKAAGSNIFTSLTATNAAAVTSKQHQFFLSQLCNPLLPKNNSSQNLSTTLRNVAAVVADRVLDTLAAELVPLDTEILAMVMNAYTS